MNMSCIKNTLIRTAKVQLDTHKLLGADSHLSILEVAELIDIVKGYHKFPKSRIGNSTTVFSLN
ncbi:hypothetical protein [Crocinitomix catalasitica]|uniref:hypothetical protein n=1 Tax=Crocinitomix catalasitica TaxID=184607 RepID=UPI000481119E|nr:hypothetical protein [Crocinitomix catalasitica]